MLSNLFNNFIYDPIFQLLIFIYENASFETLGLAIVVLTIIIRVVLLPLFYKSAKSQAIMQKLKPEIDKIRKKFKENREKQGQELMKLYKKHNFNPFSGFLVLFVQLPVFFALFKIFKDVDLITETFSHTSFLGASLVETSIVLTLIVAVLQYFQASLTMSANKSKGQGDNPMAKFGGMFKYIAPAISFFVLIYLPSALAVYWGISTLFSVGQQAIINKKLDKDDLETEDINIEEKTDNKENK